MSVNTPPGDLQRDAKAQAAAEKAYRKASRPWFKKKRFILPLILVAIILISSLANGGNKGAGDTDNSAAPATGNSPAAATSAPTKAAAAAFPGAKDGDVVGNAGAVLKLGDATVTAAPLANGDATLNPTLCTSVKLVNGSKDTISFNLFDWKIQTPSGTIVNTGFTGSDSMLSSGEIAPGGSATGDVCFDNKKAEKGTFVVLYEPVFNFFSDRAAWINKR